MEWSQQFLDKEYWQRNTFERIKNDLLSVKGNRFVQYGVSKEKYLVMVYGKSQVGKSTMILSMIGIEDRFFQEVYDTLRAGIPRGNSSTSMAIIYAQSENDQYGCCLTSVNKMISKNIQYYEREKMIEQLAQIRTDVENNKITSDSILYIYIPRHFFHQDDTAEHISIIDMPGVESRNSKEAFYVQKLMRRYISVATVCIITCRSNDIQSLETLVLPDYWDWKRMNHRFIIVVTHAYNDGTIKQYFKIERSKREKKFYEYVTERYISEVKKILGEHNQIEVYPVDVGDTLKRLCTNEIQDEMDRKEIMVTKEAVLSALRYSIVKRKGQRLESALQDLRKAVEHYGEDEIPSINEDIEECEKNIKDYENKINERKSCIADSKAEQDEKERAHTQIFQLYQTLSRQKNYRVINLSDQMEKYIKENGLYKTSGSDWFLADKGEKVKRELQKICYFRIEECKKRMEECKKRMEEIRYMEGNEAVDINICTLESSELMREVDDCVSDQMVNLYPPKRKLFFKEKVYSDMVKEVCNKIQNEINLKLDCYNDKILYLVKKSIDNLNSEIKEKAAEIHRIERKKSEITNKKDKKAEERDKHYRKREEIQQIKQQDEDTLKVYMGYAKDAYLEQRNHIVNWINISASSSEKFILFLFLGVLEKNYLNTVGGINGNES